jgi:predicted hotdog family 3-hydroxylacyl-ACP dehydratase
MTKPAYLISEVLPHAGAMLLLDELLEIGADHVTCAVGIRPGIPFCDDASGVPAWVGLEYMAQAMCAYSGVEEVRAGRAPSIGLLLGSRHYQCDRAWFGLGAHLVIRADLELRDDNNLVAFRCTIHDGAQLIAQGDVKAYRPGDVMSVIRREQVEGR